jgi:hypothetical protein
MSEPPPPPYISREFVCQVCGKTFTPSAEESESLAELERTFGLKPESASATCEECQARKVQ